jgi:hypothetical protein
MHAPTWFQPVTAEHENGTVARRPVMVGFYHVEDDPASEGQATEPECTVDLVILGRDWTYGKVNPFDRQGEPTPTTTLRFLAHLRDLPWTAFQTHERPTADEQDVGRVEGDAVLVAACWRHRGDRALGVLDADPPLPALSFSTSSM